MIHDQPVFRNMGDRSLIVELGDEIDRRLNRDVRRLYYSLKNRDIEGVIELLPCYASLMIVFDPLRISLSTLKSLCLRLLQSPDSTAIPNPKTVEIPVVYGGECGPDLGYVATYHRITPEAVIRYHAQTTYYVYMIGFTPGYPYMGEVPEEIATPRRETPRTRVPKGSVGIAQRQTGVYPVESPGGWQIIGRTPMGLFDPRAWPPTPLETGDSVRFYPIEREAFDDWQP